MTKKITNRAIAEFFTRLEGKEGCFRKDKEGDRGWNCEAGIDKTKSRLILKRMGFDINQIIYILGKMQEAGGSCDCGIILNAKRKFNKGKIIL